MPSSRVASGEVGILPESRVVFPFMRRMETRVISLLQVSTVPKLSLGATNKQTSAKKDKVNNQLQQQANKRNKKRNRRKTKTNVYDDV